MQEYAYLVIYSKDHNLIDDLQLSLRVTTHDIDQRRRQQPQNNTVGRASYKASEFGQGKFKENEMDQYFNAFIEEERLKQ